MVDVEKMINIVKEKISYYQLYKSKIEKLNTQKDTTNKNTDLNSWIRSINSTTDKTANSAIKNIEINEKIKNIMNWKLLIDEVIEFYKKKDIFIFEIITNKALYGLSDTISMELIGISRTTYYKYLQIIYCEIGINSIERGLIVFDEIKC